MPSFAEYGRPSSYQQIQNATETPRFKVLLRRTWDVSTVARGGNVSGVVVDYIGRPVPGARVRLGPYSADADMNGAYVFENVPRGEFALELDPNLLPADYAWDGRARHLSVTQATRSRIELVVAPLNAIHGRVYADRNGNGRFDSGEGVLGAAVCLDERVTATDANGAYDFYNVPPGAHAVRLDPARLPEAFAIPDPRPLQVELSQGARPPARTSSSSRKPRHHLAGNQMRIARRWPLVACSKRLRLILVTTGCLLAAWQVDSAPETVKITVPASVGFAVTNVGASTNGNPAASTVSFSSLNVSGSRVLQISVKADSDFVPPGGPAIPASKVSWTTSAGLERNWHWRHLEYVVGTAWYSGARRTRRVAA